MIRALRFHGASVLLAIVFFCCLVFGALAILPSGNVTIFLAKKHGVLHTLKLNSNTFTAGNPQGTFVGNVSNTTVGSTVSFNSLSVAGSLQLAKIAGIWQVQVGPSAPATAGTITFNLVETLKGAVDSPHTSSGLSVVENPAVGAAPVNTVLPQISGVAQVGQVLTTTNGTWTNSPTSFTYQWNGSASAPPSTVFGPTAFTLSNTGDQGYQFREVIPAASLTASGTVTGSIRVGFNFTAGTTAGTMVAYIGEQGAGNPWNFDGTQVRLTFGGLTTLSGINGASTVFSDYVPFTLNASKALVISMFYNGTAVNVGELDGTPINVYYDNVVIDPSATAPTGLTTSAGTVLTAGEVDFTGSGGGPITGATAQTYTPVVGDVGNTLTVTVIAKNGIGSSLPATSVATSPVAAAASTIPVNTALPVISGTAQVGQTLTTTNGTWTNSPSSFTYQWKSAGVNATGAGATTASYTAVAADVGHTLTVAVIATSTGPGGGASTPATSAATAAVIDIIPTNTGIPTISGTAQVGQTLTATTGTWTHNPTGFTYQWNRGATIVSTASTYVPVAADVGSTLTVTVVAMNSGGLSAPATSAATAAVIAAVSGVPVNTALPTISGTAQAGQTLTAGNGTWTNSPTSFTYSWASAAPTPDITGFNSVGPITVGNGSYSIENAQQTWSLTNSDSQTLAFQVRPGDVWSGDVGRPGPPNRSEVDGFAQMFTPGTEVNISYNFDMTSATARTDAAGIVIGQAHNNDTQLGGATSSPLELDLQPLDFMSIYIGNLTASPTPTGTVADFGTQVVNGVGIHYYQVYADPNPIVRNHNYKMQIQFKYTVGGDNSGFFNVWRDGVQIVHSTGQLGFGFNIYWKYGIYGTVTNATQIAQYQNMMVASRPLVLGTGSTYVPVAGDVANAVNLTVTASNGSGAGLPATSAATSAVAAAASNVPVNTALPVISGTAQVAQTLTTTNGTWTNSPTSFTYQWKRAGVAIGGATATTYVPVSADVGNTLTVTVTAINGSGSGVATSTATGAVTAASIACSTVPNGSNPVFDPKEPAHSGYELVFDSEFNNENDMDKSCTSPPSDAGCTNLAGSNWYLNNWSFPNTATNPVTDIDIEAPPYQSAKSTVLHVHPTPATGGWALSTMGISSGASHGPAAWQQGWNGKLFTGGWYVEARVSSEWVSYSTGQVVPAPGASQGHVTIWAYSADPRITGASRWAEDDFIDGYYGTAFYLTSLIDWAPGNPTASSDGNGCIGSFNLVNIISCGFASNFTDRHTAHIYGQLWVPATATTQGFVQQYFDGVAMGTFTWNQYSGLPPTGANIGSIIDLSHLQVNLGNDSSPVSQGNTSTSWWDWVHVWQLPAAATASGNANIAPQANFTGGTGSCPNPNAATRTASLLGTFGISGHVPAYADNSQTVADATYLGIGAWRDGISGNSPATLSIYQGLYNAGIRFIGLPWLPTDITFPGNVTGAKQILALGAGALLAVEGPNEPSISTFTYNGFNSATTWQGVSQWQSGWYSAVHADPTLSAAGIPVTTPTLVGAEATNWGLQFLTTPSGTLAATGLQYADWYNSHVYPMFGGAAQTIDPVKGDYIQGQFSADFVSTFLHGFAGSTLSFVNSKPRVITEFGYMTVPAPSAGGTTVDTPTQGKDILNGLMNAFNEGFQATNIYTFYPFSGDGTEIFNGPGNPKASAVYLHNFTTPLKDAGANAKTFLAGSLNYTLSGLPATGKALLFEKSNGRYEIVIWNNVTNWNFAAGTPITIGATNVTVTLGLAATTLNIYDPTVQSTPITTGSGTTITAGLRDYPMIIEVIP